MITLSPPLVLAALHAMRAMPARMRVPRPHGAADTEFIYHLATAAHRDPQVGLSPWPIPRGLCADGYRNLAWRSGLARATPELGDLVVLSPDDRQWPSLVAIVGRVDWRPVDPVGPTTCDLVFGYAEDDSPTCLRVDTITRLCGPTRGDVILRWAEWPRNGVFGRAA